MEILTAIWGYLTLGVSTMVTQELGALVGGFAAEQRHLDLTLVLITCATAVFVESVALYSLGRWNAAWVRLRLRKASPVARRLLRSMRYSPWRATIISRFAFGARIPLPLACGAARVPSWIFLTGTAIASVIWASVFVGLGWVFGEGAVLVVGEVRRFEWVIGAVLVLAVAGVFWWLKKKEREARAKDPTAGTPPPI
ncbi:MAG: DedA family protein [Gemmatimonadaceae bacterium]|nr:DedA family protein [Gemmatimonadaceae bacterium]